MLLERQIKNHIKLNYIPTILKQIPNNLDGTIGLLSLSVRLDLTKTIRQNNQVGIFIIGNYQRFIYLVDQSIIEAMEEQKISIPQYGINASYTVSNCPLPRHNLESMEFLSASYEQENGVLVFLKDAQIRRIDQPQLYLFSWEEVWTGMCSCAGERRHIKKKQNLLDIVKNKSQNLKEAACVQVPRCSQCSSKLKNLGIQDKIFLNCQKMKVLVSIKGDNPKQQLFQKGQFQIFIDQGNSGKLKQGQIIDICCYYSAEPKIIKIQGEQIQLKTQTGLFLVTYYPPSNMSSTNNLFYSRLSQIGCQYIKCDNPNDDQTISYNYRCLLSSINSVKFPYLSQNCFSTLKLVIVNCLFNHLHQIPLHVLVITDQVNLLEKALRLESVLIKKWPSLYDHASLELFLNSCHNCILMVSNPNKKDFEYLNNILNEKSFQNINFTIWVLTQPNKDLKKDFSIDKIHVVMDLSMQKNSNVCRNMYDEIIDQKLQSFIKDDDILRTAPRSNEKVKDQLLDSFRTTFEGVEPSEDQMEKQHSQANTILQRYFIKAREYKHINPNSLQNIKRIAEGFSFFRSYLREKGKVTTNKVYVNILDAILAIFIEEQTSRNKYSSSNTLFSNQISKLMLNEGDCQLSFWDYQFNQNEQIGQSRRYIKREDMFKRLVNKLITLLYTNELQ